MERAVKQFVDDIHYIVDSRGDEWGTRSLEGGGWAIGVEKR